MQEKTEIEITKLLSKIFDNSSNLLLKIAPNGWGNSAYVHFFHPTPEQQYEENKRIDENIKKLTKKGDRKFQENDISRFKQDDLSKISVLEEFKYVLGLSVYDIFSNNHEVIDFDNKVYNLGSFRGSGRLIADYLNSKFTNISKKYSYMDFYMGTIWIKGRASLSPFYDYIFQMLKDEKCDWNYTFPRLYCIDFSNKAGDIENDNITDYKPEEAVINDLQKKEKEKKAMEFQSGLDSSFQYEYEEAKYKPLTQIVQSYKNIYGILPNGHPQKEFE